MYYFDKDASHKAISFIETFITHTTRDRDWETSLKK